MIKDILDDVLLVAEAGATAAEVIERIINIGQQSGLMTDAETADYRAKVAARFKGPEFRTDAEIGQLGPGPSTVDLGAGVTLRFTPAKPPETTDVQAAAPLPNPSA